MHWSCRRQQRSVLLKAPRAEYRSARWCRPHHLVPGAMSTSCRLRFRLQHQPTAQQGGRNCKGWQGLARGGRQARPSNATTKRRRQGTRTHTHESHGSCNNVDLPFERKPPLAVHKLKYRPIFSKMTNILKLKNILSAIGRLTFQSVWIRALWLGVRVPCYVIKVSK